MNRGWPQERSGADAGGASLFVFLRWRVGAPHCDGRTAVNPLRLVAISVAAALCFLTGCGTLARISMYADPESFHNRFTAFYPATDYDLVAISTGGRHWLAGHPQSEATASGWDLGLVVPLHILDLPISLVTDTLCLPWDTVTAIKVRKGEADGVHEQQER